ncbi:MAG: DUF1684 domain-containing protein [Acidimicrobiales bacterium]
MEIASTPADPFGLLDWRRRVASLYQRVRADRDPAGAHEQWRIGRDDLLRSHSQSPIPVSERSSFTGAPVAAYDPSLRFDAPIEHDVEPRSFEVVTGTDGTVRFSRVGVARLGDLGSLDVWWLNQYGGGLFVPIKDALAGTRTYGGGRYVIDTVKGADLGSSTDCLIIDLNFAYNPSCAYDPAWACPLAPPGNVISAPVLAGELSPR